MTFQEALVPFLEIWTDEKIRKERLGWRCHQARELADNHLHNQEILNGTEFSDRELGITIHRAFGAPGDFGYGTPEGDTLRTLYESQPGDSD